MSIYRTAGPVDRGDVVALCPNGRVRRMAMPGTLAHLEDHLRDACQLRLRIDHERLSIKHVRGKGVVLLEMAGHISHDDAHVLTEVASACVPLGAEVRLRWTVEARDGW